MLDQILLIKEILELALKYKKQLFIIAITLLFPFLLLIFWGSNINNKQKKELNHQWKNLCLGDSIFVKQNIYNLDFFKKGREKLAEYEQREIKYKRDDTLNFVKKNSVHEKFFFKNSTSFIGICIGKDTSITKAGEYNSHKWIMIKPSYDITHPPPSDEYDYEKRKWRDELTSYSFVGTLSKNYFINFSDIQLTNNDDAFK